MIIKIILLFLLSIIQVNTNNDNSKTNELLIKGKQNYNKYLCHICHGLDGKNVTSQNYPRLAGQNSEYLYNQIINIKENKRNNGLSLMMRPYIKKISNEEIKNISLYLESLN